VLGDPQISNAPVAARVNDPGHARTSRRADTVTTFVLVPGGWHGAYSWQPTVDLLVAQGHEVRALTLSGLGHDHPRRVPEPNLDDHIAQVVAELDRVDGPVTLCGHSYGGMVITGAADRAPHRVDRLVYVDAYVPEDGDSCWSLTSDDFRQLFTTGAAGDGRTVAVPPGLDPRARPHPVASFLQAVRLTGAVDGVARRTAVFATNFPDTPFAELRRRLRADPTWDVHDVHVGHAVQRLAPAALTEILLGSGPIPSTTAESSTIGDDSGR
jgi:pimeloyl-ACP methyl ester carboxylesterase